MGFSQYPYVLLKTLEQKQRFQDMHKKKTNPFLFLMNNWTILKSKQLYKLQNHKTETRANKL